MQFTRSVSSLFNLLVTTINMFRSVSEREIGFYFIFIFLKKLNNLWGEIIHLPKTNFFFKNIYFITPLHFCFLGIFPSYCTGTGGALNETLYVEVYGHGFLYDAVSRCIRFICCLNFSSV